MAFADSRCPQSKFHSLMALPPMGHAKGAQPGGQSAPTTPLTPTYRTVARNNSEDAYVHDPYSFYVYARYTGIVSDPEEDEMPQTPSGVSLGFPSRPSGVYESLEGGSEVGTSNSAASTTSSNDDEARNALRANRRRVEPPCGHDQYKRLRFKKGLSHFLCTVCSHKWKQAGV